MGNSWPAGALDMLLPRLPLAARRAVLFSRAHGRLPGRPPVTFTDKIDWRVVHDRRPLVARLGDKLAMKEYAAAVCPDLRVPEVVWTGTDLDALARAGDRGELPERFVLKPNHGTMRVHVVAGRPDVALLGRVTTDWLDEPLYRSRGEWVYSRARRLLLAEQFLGTPAALPVDLKLLVFGGRVRLVQVDSGRLTDGHARRLYTPDWHPFEVAEPGIALAPPVPAPAELPRLLDVAERLGAELDFVRVDLYAVAGEVWFSELTPYPGGGLDRYDPGFDALLGSWWQLPPRAAVRAR